MSQTPNQNPTPSDGDSAEPAEALWLLVGSDDAVNQKCSTCKIVTQHEFIKIEPVPVGPEDPMEVVKRVRRVSLCTICGKLSLTL